LSYHLLSFVLSFGELMSRGEKARCIFRLSVSAKGAITL
jgi:hypothetical protein